MQICEYKYDAWGKPLAVTDMDGNAITSATHPANMNPIRYRGYYYDSETGLYYLQSRYYDPEIGRFINADGYISTGQGLLDKNMFAYCLNNTVNYKDSTGTIAVTASMIAFLISAVKALSISITIVMGTILAAKAMQSASQAISDNRSRAKDKIKEKVKEKEKEITKNPPNKKQAVFPADPYQFNPRGLERVIRVPLGEGVNGGIIQWVIPGTTSAIFEYNEDYKYGSHYHALLIEWDNKHDDIHYPPGSPIPEPWNSQYF